MKTVGILGGMGPAATMQLANEIIRQTPARIDQDHIPMVIHNNTKIPDRTKAIKGECESPLPELKRSIDILSKEADFILMPCNTSHYFYDALQEYSPIPILHYIKETAIEIKKSYPDVKQVGLLATDGTVYTGLYQHFFLQVGIEVIIPQKQEQEIVMQSIYAPDGIKAGFLQRPRAKLQAVAQLLISRGADLIIGGCTEIPLALKQEHVSFVVLDPTKIMAKVAISLAKQSDVIVVGEQHEHSDIAS